jgi:hypothetical protein
MQFTCNGLPIHLIYTHRQRVHLKNNSYGSKKRVTERMKNRIIFGAMTTAVLFWENLSKEKILIILSVFIVTTDLHAESYKILLSFTYAHLAHTWNW